jgi:hypothetical protein
VQVGELFPGLGHLYKCPKVIRLGRQLQRLLAAILSAFFKISYVPHDAFRFLRQPSISDTAVAAEVDLAAQ